MRLFLIRHPRPVIEPGICYGSSDLVVHADECERVCETLHLQLPVTIPIYSSPLARCMSLATRLASRCNNGTVIVDVRLVEMNFGDWEQREWNLIGKAPVDAWCADPLGFRPGGGETVREVAQRVHAFWTMLLAQSVKEAIVVCHAGTIRLLQACALYASIDDIAHTAFHQAATAHFGELLILDMNDEDRVQLPGT